MRVCGTGAEIPSVEQDSRRSIVLEELVGVTLLYSRCGTTAVRSPPVTFSFAICELAENSRAAADLLGLCAFLAPDAIPEESFTQGATELGDRLSAAAHSPLDFAKVLRAAGRFSLIHRTLRAKRWTCIG